MHQKMLGKTAIFYDLGKVQPYLVVEEIVNPKEAFEPGKFHTFRGALLARKVYPATGPTFGGDHPADFQGQLGDNTRPTTGTWS